MTKLNLQPFTERRPSHSRQLWRRFRATARECVEAFRFGIDNEQAVQDATVVAMGEMISSIVPVWLHHTTSVSSFGVTASLVTMGAVTAGFLMRPREYKAEPAAKVTPDFPHCPRIYAAQEREHRDFLALDAHPVAYGAGALTPIITGLAVPLIKMALG